MEIVTLEPSAAAPHAPAVERVADRAFAAHPEFSGRPVGAAFAAHAGRAGYRAVVARIAAGEIAGFAYGMQSFTGPPPNNRYERLVAAVGPAAATRIRGQFEIPWMAVDPDRQGRGVGRRLLDALLDGAPQAHAWLVTGAGDPAARFYAALGWDVLAVDPLGSDRDRIIFGT